VSCVFARLAKGTSLRTNTCFQKRTYTRWSGTTLSVTDIDISINVMYMYLEADLGWRVATEADIEF
jgi:hypothetical protein